jgi:hypothetical protein
VTPEERSLRARLAAHESWARTTDAPARTVRARQAFEHRFETQVDSDGTLDPKERARRAESARKAYFTRLALRSSVSRRRAVEARSAVVRLERAADDADAELASTGTHDAESSS